MLENNETIKSRIIKFCLLNRNVNFFILSNMLGY